MYDMIWYDMIWYDIWHDIIWYDVNILKQSSIIYYLIKHNCQGNQFGKVTQLIMKNICKA